MLFKSPQKFHVRHQSLWNMITGFTKQSWLLCLPTADFLWSLGKADYTLCAVCDIELTDWERADSPHGRHSIESPNCPMVLGKLEKWCQSLCVDHIKDTPNLFVNDYRMFEEDNLVSLRQVFFFNDLFYCTKLSDTSHRNEIHTHILVMSVGNGQLECQRCFYHCDCWALLQGRNVKMLRWQQQKEMRYVLHWRWTVSETQTQVKRKLFSEHINLAINLQTRAINITFWQQIC